MAANYDNYEIDLDEGTIVPLSDGSPCLLFDKGVPSESATQIYLDDDIWCYGNGNKFSEASQAIIKCFQN